MNSMPPSVSPPLPTPRLPDFLQNVYSTVTPSPDLGNMMQSGLPSTTSRPELNLNGLGSSPVVDTTIGQGQLTRNWISGNTSEQERLMLSARDLNFNARLLGADQLASLPPFSINSRNVQKSIPQKPQRGGFKHGRSCTYVGGSSATKAVANEPSKLKQPRNEPDDAGRGKKHGYVPSGGWPSSQDNMSFPVEQSMEKQIVTNLGSCAGDDGLNGKDLQSGTMATSVDPLDGYVKSFLVDDEGPNDMSSSFCTSPGSSLSRGDLPPKGN
ncbi:zinc finger CCCH domain-containing protein 55-like [Dorcoceras hygrometricum]|uniref:Zinc finger CCCH domain-containing protein 55-like n=1 Tax=Dorcoceras hygrometricum TaxID=472368 RepID=A0A2Z7D823_9LAMI|nr:zinc finger CCCH domain-containing protein 55-like [Dorcoceras hygrometricum]